MSIFAESAESAESAKPIFANRGVKDVRVSLDQYPTNIQRISNLYITPNRYLTRFAAVFALVFVLGVGNVWGDNAPVNTILWSEDFSGYSANNVPNGSITNSHTGTTVYDGSVTYTCTNGQKSGKTNGGTTKIYAEKNAGGTSPELLVGKKGGASVAGGTFSISGIPSGGATKLTVSYKQNASGLSASVSGTEYSGSNSANTAGTKSFDVTVGSASTFTLTFTATSTSNVRLDDISVVVKTAGTGGSTDPTSCATPTFSVDEGTYTSTQNVALSCETDDATIYYTTDGTDPTESETKQAYTTAISVSSTQTIKAYAEKDGLDNSSVASAEYKIYPVVHAGTSADPYTVADARNMIDANKPTNVAGKYVTGKVSKVVDSNLASNQGWITYDISVDGETSSDQFRVYKGKSYSGNKFTSTDDIQVGDVVVVSGTMTYYTDGNLYEFTSGSQLVSLSRVVIVSLYNGANGATKVGDFESGTNALPTTAADVAGWTFDGNWSKDLFASKTNSQAYASGTYFARGAEEYSGTNLYAIYRRTPTVGSAIYSTQPTPGYPLSLDPATGDLRISANKDLAFIPVGESVTLSAVGGLVTTWTVYDSDLNDITSSFTYTSSSNTSFVFDMPAQEILVEATMCALPAVPSGLSTSLHDGGTRGKTVFSWTAGSGATKYTLTYTKAGSDPVVVSDIANTTYTVNPLAVGEYTWSVKSVNDCGESAAVNGEGFTICPDFAAITPTVGETSSIAQTTATANWTAVADAAKYTVQIFNGETRVAEYENVTATSKAITGLSANTTYVVKVIAYNACGEASLAGASASFTTLKNVYSVSFNANGGTGSIEAVNVTDGEATTLPSSGFTKAGFSLSGWKVNNEGALLEKGASYTVTGAATLYAQWSPNTINVTYKPNGPTADEVAESFTYGEEYNAKAANTFSREGYQFKHWNNAADGLGAVTLAAGAAYTGTEDIDLYAIWDQLYTVRWVVNGTTKSTQTAIAGAALTEPYAPQTSDCDNSKVFVGWTTTEHYTDAIDAPDVLFDYANTLTMPAGGATYYAVFADETPGSNDASVTSTFTDKAWGEGEDGTNDDLWTSGQDGNQMQTGHGIQVTKNASGANATTKASYGEVSSVVITYSTNASGSAGSIAIQVGSTNYVTDNNVTVSEGTTDRTTTFTAPQSTDDATGAVKITVTCTTNSVYVKSVKINYKEDATVRTNYTTDCNTVLPVCETPTFNIEEGEYTVVKNVTIETATEGATIYYTTDGSNPATSETKQTYSSAVRVDHTLTLKAVAVKENYINSTVKSAEYTINLPQCATPTFSVAAGRYTETKSVELSCETEGADIYYTTDGETPTTGSTKYTEAISVATNMTIKAVAIAENTTLSEVASAKYKIVGPGSTLWELVENANDLNDGDIIVIASNTQGKTTNSTITTSNSANYFGEEVATFSEDKSEITELSDDAQQFTLGKSGNYWTLSNGTQYLKETAVKKLAWDNNTFNWAISIDETTHAATISNSNTAGDRILHNVTNNRFTTYSSDLSATMLLPQIYRKTVICVDPETELAFASSVPTAIDASEKAQLATTGGNGNTVAYSVISNNANAASIDNQNKFSAVVAGTYTVQARQAVSNDYKCAQTATIDIVVTVAATGIELNKTELSLEESQVETLVATVKPNDASNKNVTWSVTEGSTFIEVDQTGKVTAKAIGNGTVQVETEDGHFIATCAVTVTAPKPTLTLTTTNPLAFGNVEQNLTKDLTVNLKGSNLVADASYTITGDGAAFFSVVTALDNTTISSEDGQTLTIRFAPTAEGNKSATITFSSGGVASQTLTVTGTGKKRYTATLHAGNGSVTSETIQESSIGSGITLPEATLSQKLQDGGWSFAGWSETELSDETAEVPTTINAGAYAIAADIELYAIYTRSNVVEKTASKNSGFSAYSNVTIEEGKPIKFTASNGSGESNHVRVHANATLTVNGNGTTVKKVEFVSLSSYKATNFTVNDVSLTGEVWEGSATSVVFTATKQVRFSSIAVTYQTSEGLFTTYPAELLAIKFDLNGGTGNFPSQTVVKGSSYTIDAAEPTKPNHDFIGWNDGSTTYQAAETIENVQDNITLTAQWDEWAKATTITFKNGETTVDTKENIYKGASYTTPAAPVVEGKLFQGWNDGENTYAAETEVAVPNDLTENITITYNALWKDILPQPTTSVDLSGGKWILVTNTNQLRTGDMIVIAAADYNYALGTNQKTNNRSKATVTKVVDTLNIEVDVAPLFLQNGKIDGTFALYDRAYNEGAGGYLYAASSGSNYLRTQATIDENASWIITIADKKASIIAQGENTHNSLRYNAGGGNLGTDALFSCYTSGQEDITIYKWHKILSEDINVSDLEWTDAVIVADGKTLTVDENRTLDNLTVEAGGKVDGLGNLTVNDFTIEGQDGKSGQVMNADKLTINGDAYFDFTLAVSRTKAANQWHNFSVPFPVSVMDGVYNAETGAKLTNEVDYAIEDYHGDLRAQGKYGWKKYRGIMQPGITYSMTVNGDIQTFRFKKVAGAYSFDANPSVGFSQYNSGENTDAGWNGLGNMRLCYASVNNENIKENNGVRYVQILDAAEYAYKSYAVGEINLTVGSAFFIQAANNGTMTFAAAHNAPDIVYAPARTEAKRTDKPIAVTLSNENQSDRMYITASEDAKSEYQIGCDLQKMFATNTPQAPMIYSVNYGGIKLAAEEAPIVNDKASYALSLYAPADGTYRIETPTESENADLYLTKDGHVIWNLSMNGYEVELTKGTTEGYGLLLVRKAPSVATGVEEPTSDSSLKGRATKVVIDEHVYILRDGQMYDVTGKAVK
jgi:uncharacterized repeat protein (TIGR02543 family)